LEELLALMRFAGADDVVLDIEVKTDRAKGREYSHSIVWWLASILRVHESGQALRVRSFDPLVIKAMGEEIPSVPRVALCREAVGPDPGLYPSDTCALIEAALAAGAEAVAPEVNLLDEKLVARAHAAGLKVYPWTLVTEEQIANAVSLGVDGVCVNDVALARATFAGLGQEVPVPRPISLPILR
jgi:glycerophosphoryl diester phosphodiesterase